MQQYDERLARRIFWVLVVAVFIYMLLSVPLYGITGDEVTQWNYGKFVWGYIKSFGADKHMLTNEYIDKKGLLYYGGFFDGFSQMLISIFHPKDEFLLRHYWNALFGFLGIVMTGLLAKEFRGWLAAIVALIFIFFTGRYFGEAFNNPKDAPFAATYILALFSVIRWFRNLENLKWKDTILMGVALGLCISVRIGGVLIVLYIIMLYISAIWQKKLIGTKTLGNSLKHLAAGSAIGYVVALLWWPYALENPFLNPFRSLQFMSAYPAEIKVMFEGNLIYTTDLPWYYLPEWLAIGLPLFALIGFLGGLVLLLFFRRNSRIPFLGVLIFATIFPVVYILIQHSVVYDGFRHVLFILPVMAVVAAVFFVYLFETLSAKGMKYVVAAIVIVLVALPARFCLANHPNEYVYFNELVGGIKGAYGKYETDYYMNSIKQGCRWLIENELKGLHTKDTLIVASNCAEPLAEYEKVSPVPFHTLFSRFYEKNQKDWDYAVFYGRFLSDEQLLSGYFPSSMAIHVISADGVPLCAILKNDPGRNGYRGFKALKKADTVNAVELFRKAVAKYPGDMEIDTFLHEYAKTKAVNFNNYIAEINKAIVLSSTNWTDSFILYKKSGEYKKLRGLREKLSEYIARRINDVKTVEAPGRGAEQLRKSEIAYLEIEEKITNNNFKAFERLTAKSTKEEKSDPENQLRNVAKEEQTVLNQLRTDQQNYARNNNFKLNKKENQ